MNGHAVDGKVVESLARGSGIVDAEPVSDDERFDVRKIEARPSARKDADAGKTKPTSKDAR
jgi:hypothetical protein